MIIREGSGVFVVIFPLLEIIFFTKVFGIDNKYWDVFTIGVIRVDMKLIYRV